MLEKTSLDLTGFIAARSRFLCTSFHPLTLAASSMASKEATPCKQLPRSGPHALPGLVGDAGGPASPGSRTGPRAASGQGHEGSRLPPRCVPAPLREMVLLVLVSDVNPYKSPDQR